MQKHSRKLLSFIMLLMSLAIGTIFAISPVQAQTTPSTTQTINFTARLKGSDGTVAPDGYYNVSFRLYNSATSGSPVWSETHYDENGTIAGADHRIKVTNGSLTAKLGSRTAFNDSVNWDDNLWLTMNIGGTSQNSSVTALPWDGEMSPRIELNAVPYAMNAGLLGGRAAGDFVQLGQGTQTNSTDNPSIQINTTGSGDLIQLQRDAQDVFTVDNNGNIVFGNGADHTISIDQSAADTDGKTLVLTGGDGGDGNSDGGNIVLSGGAGSGNGANGLVVLATTAFATSTNDANCYTGGATVASSCTIAQATVDGSSATIIGFSTANQTANLPDPSVATPGRILYVMAANDSLPFLVALNENETLPIQPKAALTLLWNGSDWVVAGHNGLTNNTPVDPQVVTEEEETTPPLILEEKTPEPVAIEQSEPTGTPTTEEPVDKNQPLQLGQLESAPMASPGTMYYDSTLGKVQCYEASGWGPCGDAPDTFVAISPEYTNAVMNGTDIGIISSNFCSGSLGINDGSDAQPAVCNHDETYNFYQWTSEETSSQTRSIYLTYQLPDNFKSFVPGSAAIMGRTDSDNANVSYQVYRDNGEGLVSCGSLVSVSSGLQSSWQRGIAADKSDPASCDFEAGDSILFRINLTSQRTANAYVSNVNFIFRNS